MQIADKMRSFNAKPICTDRKN